MEFPIDFKTITEVHLVPSRSRVHVQKHQVPIPIPDTAAAQKNLTIYTIFFLETMKPGNTENGSGTAFLKLYFLDCISVTAVLRSWKLGIQIIECHQNSFQVCSKEMAKSSFIT